jgi:quercetin dioxygenase-like cupin family protein
VDVGESWLEVLLRGAETDGQFGAFVFHHAPNAENPPHPHQGFAKVLYVLDGRYEFRVGDAAFSAGPGSLVLVPQGSQHAFTTSTGGRMMFVCTPSGNEEMLLEIGALGPDPSLDQLAQVSARFSTAGLPGPEGPPGGRSSKPLVARAIGGSVAAGVDEIADCCAEVVVAPGNG